MNVYIVQVLFFNNLDTRDLVSGALAVPCASLEVAGQYVSHLVRGEAVTLHESLQLVDSVNLDTGEPEPNSWRLLNAEGTLFATIKAELVPVLGAVSQ